MILHILKPRIKHPEVGQVLKKKEPATLLLVEIIVSRLKLQIFGQNRRFYSKMNYSTSEYLDFKVCRCEVESAQAKNFSKILNFVENSLFRSNYEKIKPSGR